MGLHSLPFLTAAGLFSCETGCSWDQVTNALPFVCFSAFLASLRSFLLLWGFTFQKKNLQLSFALGSFLSIIVIAFFAGLLASALSPLVYFQHSGQWDP